MTYNGGGVLRKRTVRQIHGYDPWELGHYRDRIGIYYPQADDASLVRFVLDELAVSPEPRFVQGLFRTLKSHRVFHDRERLLSVLRLMERDHYLARTPEGAYEFCFPLVRRWWKLDRGL